MPPSPRRRTTRYLPRMTCPVSRPIAAPRPRGAAIIAEETPGRTRDRDGARASPAGRPPARLGRLRRPFRGRDLDPDLLAVEDDADLVDGARAARAELRGVAAILDLLQGGGHGGLHRLAPATVPHLELDDHPRLPRRVRQDHHVIPSAARLTVGAHRVAGLQAEEQADH